MTSLEDAYLRIVKLDKDELKEDAEMIEINNEEVYELYRATKGRESS